MGKFEDDATRYENIAKRIIKGEKKVEQQNKKAEQQNKKLEKAQQKLEKAIEKRGGIYASSDTSSLPTAFVKAQQKQQGRGLSGGRAEDSNKKLTDDTIKEKIEKEIENKGGGIYASSPADASALPSAFIKKQEKQKDRGLFGGRSQDSNEKLTTEKIRAETEKENLSAKDSILRALGVKSSSSKTTAKSLVSGAGAPIQKNNEFKKLTKKVSGLENNQKAFAKIFSQGQSVVGGVSSFTSISGAIGFGSGLLSKLPYAAVVIGIASQVYESYIKQYGPGGTRDTRKKVSAESASLIGVEEENNIAGGARLFLSNPNYNQGLPISSSNTQNLRDGARRYNLRKQGDLT